MKKIFCFIVLSVVLAFSSLTYFPASAEYTSNMFDGAAENVVSAIREFLAIPETNEIFLMSLPPNTDPSIKCAFVEVENYHQGVLVTDTSDSAFTFWRSYSTAYDYQAGVCKFLDANGEQEYLTVKKHTITYYESSGYSDSSTTYNSCPSFDFLSSEGLARYRGVPVSELERVSFNMLQPPDVFTYNIVPSNFTLKNGGIGSVSVNFQFTNDYLNWLNTAHERGFDIDGRYSVCLWVSDVCPTADNLSSLTTSMDNSRFTKLHYGQYLYDGGPLRDQLQQSQPEGSATSNNTSIFPTKIFAEGACISAFIDPAQETNTITFLSENIQGFDTHKSIYVCCLGAYSGLQGGNITTPDMYNKVYINAATSSSGSINNTYTDYPFTGGNIRMHSYYFPFSSASSAVGDGFQGQCQYKPQTVNGKQYNTSCPVDNLTNKSETLTPDKLHDIEMKDDEWVSPKDYKAWQVKHEQEKRYGDQFDFNTQSLKDVLDKEGDFFSFIKSAFGIFPDYFMNIFVAFLSGMIVICLLKFIL